MSHPMEVSMSSMALKALLYQVQIDAKTNLASILILF